MDKKIVYENADGSISIIHPAKNCGFPIERIAQKDVPDGVLFWIVDGVAIPTDLTFRDAWEIDASAMGAPSGVGDIAAFMEWNELKEEQS